MSEDVTQQLPGDGVRQILALLNSMNARLDSMDARLTALEEKVDRRLQETRPIWEQVLSRLTDVETRLTNVEERLTKMETRFGKVEDEVFWLGRKFRNWVGDLAKLEEKHDDLEERVQQLEPEPTK
jgi:DNA repair ATPase RecN